MSKIDINSHDKKSFGEFFKKLFSSKKNIIILSSILAVIVLAITIPVIIIANKKPDSGQKEEKITINFSIYTNNEVNDENLLSGVEVFVNSTNIKIYTSPYGKFSINNIDNNFSKGDTIRLQKEGYKLYFKDNVIDSYIDGERVCVSTISNTDYIIFAEKLISEEEELLKQSVVINFLDRNNEKITEEVKAINKSTITTDIEGNYIYDDLDIEIVSTTNNGEMKILIDNNQEEKINIIFYCADYDFDELSINKSNQNTSLTLYGDLKQNVKQDISFKNVLVTLKYPNGNIVTNASGTYSYVNTYNNKDNTKLTEKSFVINEKNPHIEFEDDIMFDSITFTIRTETKNYISILYPTINAIQKGFEANLKEGFIIQAEFQANAVIKVVSETTLIARFIKCSNDKICEFIGIEKDLKFYDENNVELFLIKVDSSRENPQNITIDGSDIIYNKYSNIVLLSKFKP